MGLIGERVSGRGRGAGRVGVGGLRGASVRLCFCTMGTTITTPAQLRDAYRRVVETMARSAERSGRRAEEVVLVAVTKNASPDQIRQLVEMGHRELGESRVPQLVQRAAQLEEFLSRKRFGEGDRGAAVSGRTGAGHRWSGTSAGARSGAEAPGTSGIPGSGGVRWHMIGQLQRNKARAVLPIVGLIHSVENLRIAEELHDLGGRPVYAAGEGAGAMGRGSGSGAEAPGLGRGAGHRRAMDTEPIDVLLQVNISGEESKSGCAAPAALHLAEQIDSMVNLRLRGLMTMAPYSDHAEDARAIFARCRELFEEVRAEGIGGKGFNILSMGMSGDYPVAIEEGSNMVRVGTALFGEVEQG